MVTLETDSVRPPLVLLVDPIVASRHFMWRALNRAFGVLEADSAGAARTWIGRRPDIDALVVQDELPDERGVDLVRELATASHPVAARTIVLARRSPDWAAIAQAGLTLVERGDVRTVLSKLASWFVGRDARLARALQREAERFGS
jgi:response regulator RpfG family c-di-GMP phosphodiesterase